MPTTVLAQDLLAAAADRKRSGAIDTDGFIAADIRPFEDYAASLPEVCVSPAGCTVMLTAAYRTDSRGLAGWLRRRYSPDMVQFIRAQAVAARDAIDEHDASKSSAKRPRPDSESDDEEGAPAQEPAPKKTCV